jgi:hypothetical protein
MVRIVCHDRRTTSRDAQKGCPARPQRVKSRGVPSGYVEGLNDARTTLADFFSILLGSQRVIEAEQEGSMLSHEERERL